MLVLKSTFRAMSELVQDRSMTSMSKLSSFGQTHREGVKPLSGARRTTIDSCYFKLIPAKIWSTESGIIPNVMKNAIQECFGILSK